MAVWSAVKMSSLAPDMRLDAEYYKPNLLDLERQLRGMKTRPWGELPGRFIVGPFGSDFNVENFVDESPYRYVRGKDVKPFFLEDGDNAYIPEASFRDLKKYALRAGDLLISVVGTLGNCALVTPTIGQAVFSCKSTAWRPDQGASVLSLYLTAYLNSNVGQSFLQRLPRGHVQTGLNLEDLRSVPILEPPLRSQRRIAATVRAAQVSRHKAKDTMAAAETLLLSRLGLDHVDLSPSKSYSARFRDMQTGNRFGAEYYMPCKKRVLAAMRQMPSRTIAEHAAAVRDMWDPLQAGQGDLVRNFDVTDALEPLLDDAKEPTTAADIGSTKKRFRAGDVVISRLRSYLREIAVVRTSDTLPAVGSSEFIVLRPIAKGLSAETLMVFLRSPVIQTVLKWSQDGSHHPRFTEEDLLAIPVPDRVRDGQREIDGLVNRAIDAGRRAAELLVQAKQEVENLVAHRGDLLQG